MALPTHHPLRMLYFHSAAQQRNLLFFLPHVEAPALRVIG